jgi:hypothetical protein
MKVKNASKYNLEAFIAALYLIEVNRYFHLKGYIQGYWFSNERKQKGAVELAKILNA